MGALKTAVSVDAVIKSLNDKVEDLLNFRVKIRKDADALHQLYEDATGGYAGGIDQGQPFQFVGNPTVKAARDVLQKLDQEIGNAYRTIKALSRAIKKAQPAKQAATGPLPTINLNGSDPKSLSEAYRLAGTKLYDAQDALAETAPHGRDYPEADFQAAKKAHIERLEKIQSVIDELGELHEGVLVAMDERQKRKSEKLAGGEWKRFSVSKAVQRVSGDVVATNGQYEVWAHRFRAGDEGRRRYVVGFDAIEILDPTPGNRKVREITLPTKIRSNLGKIVEYLSSLPSEQKASTNKTRIAEDMPVEDAPAIGTPAPDSSEFKAALKGFMAFAQSVVDENQKQYPNATSHKQLTAEAGKRYIRIVRNDIANDTGKTFSRSVHCFIDTTNGDVLKAASWKVPAKHARGNIFKPESYKGAVGPHGGTYMR